MALPRVNTSSWFDIQVPSTKQDIQIRPFLVKEQKLLLIASESQDRSQIINSMLDTISACTREEIDVKKLTTFDVDYIFSQIRAKSVGETSNLLFVCTECQHKNEIPVNVNDAKVEGTIEKPIIDLTPDIKVKMMYPSYHTLTKNTAMMSGNDQTQMAFEFIKMCMVAVITEDEQILIRDESDDNVNDFLESLSSEQFQKLTQFLENAPKMTTKVEFKCESCGSDQHSVLEGLEDFF